MRFISKNSEPVSFTVWKQQANADWQPSWENFQKPEKIDVLNALLIEQGSICCYCGQRINATSSHIEHLKPRKHFPAEKLAYENFLASCPGYPEDEADSPPNPLLQEFCGHKKSDWYDPDLLVSPLQANCGEHFQFPNDGYVEANQNHPTPAAALETIKRLGLNHNKLINRRKKAIEGLGLTDLALNFSDDEIRQFIHGLNQPDSFGELTPFCFALIYQLKDYLGD